MNNKELKTVVQIKINTARSLTEEDMKKRFKLIKLISKIKALISKR